MDFRVRPMTEAEAVLVKDSWTRTTTDQGPGRYACRLGECRVIGWAWFDMHRAWVRERLADPGTSVLVATLAGSDEALGWVCFSPPADHLPLVFHYLYTIPVGRRTGVARRLVAEAMTYGDHRPARMSHMTHVGEGIVMSAQVRHVRARAAVPA